MLQDGGVHRRRRRRPIDYTNLDGGTHVRIFSHTFFKNNPSKTFFGPFRAPPGLNAHIFQLLSSRHLP